MLAHLLLPAGLLLSSLFPAGGVPGVLFVDDSAPPGGNGASWTTAYDSIDTALAHFDGSGGVITEIRVAQGTYRPTFLTSSPNPRSATFFLRDALALRGGFAGDPNDPELRDVDAFPSVLSGDLGIPGDPSDNAYAVVRSGGPTQPSAVLDGFVVCDGNANRVNDRGAGLNLTGSPTVVNCRITNNKATYGGAGAHCEGPATFRDCVFESNVAFGAEGGGAVMTLATPVRFERCRFRNNNTPTRGGAIYGHASVVCVDCEFRSNSGGVGGAAWNVGRFDRCRFLDNSANQAGACFGARSLTGCFFQGNVSVQDGAAVWVNSGNLVVVNCSFLGNQSGGMGGGLLVGATTLVVSGSVFVGNRAANGAAIQDHSGGSTIANCTIVGNVATEAGGGLRVAAVASVHNSILWGNSDSSGQGAAAQISVASGSVSVVFSDIEGGWPGSGNLTLVPEFIDAEGLDGTLGTLDDNLRLSSSSPCVESGSDALLPADTLDLDGDGNTSEPLSRDRDLKLRVVGSSVDLGAYEFHPQGPASYCTAKIDSIGCLPVVGWSGYPVLGGYDDFVVHAQPVRSHRNGILVWGLASKAAPFFGGTLCVQTPTLRVPVQDSGGIPGLDDCSGLLTCSLPSAFLLSTGSVAGTQMFTQFFYRDPDAAPGQSLGMSDGLQFTMEP